MDEGWRPDLPGVGEDLTGDARPFVIFNPASGRARGARRLPLYLDLLERHLPNFDHASTTRPGEEASLADQALARGVQLIVAVGGDGTWSKVADRIVASGRKDVSFGLLPAGTGNDFAKGFGVTYTDPAKAVAALAAGKTRRVDVGRVVSEWAPAEDSGDEDGPVAGSAEQAGTRSDGLSDGWSSEPRHFLNVVGFGFDIAVIDAARGARFLKGALLYKATALQQLVSFEGLECTLSDHDGRSTAGRHLMLTISNGQIFGGSFTIAPRADLEDGKLDACAISDAAAVGRARLFGLVGKGKHEGSDSVEMWQAERFVARFGGPVRFEVDGDVYKSRTNEVHMDVLPKALTVVVP